jgi:hypothetical protein
VTDELLNFERKIFELAPETLRRPALPIPTSSAVAEYVVLGA